MAKKERVVATKGVKKKRKEPEVLDSLKPEHLNFLESSGSKLLIAQLERNNLEQVLRNKNLELELVKRDIEQTKRYVADKERSYSEIKLSRTNFIKSIKELYNISDKFSYDPKTGEVIRD